jgi:hypothetical protein
MEEKIYPYCKICQARDRETHTHDTTAHEEEPTLWSLVAELITWTYSERGTGSPWRDFVLRLVSDVFKLVRDDEEALELLETTVEELQRK